MKNNFFKSIFLYLILFLSLNNNAFSQEQFNFDVTEVQILEKGNLFIGKKRGKIETNDRVIIDANKFEYNKKLNLLKTDGNIKINDKELNLIITTDKAIYYKNKEQIFTNGNSKAIYENNLIVTANEFEFDKFKNILKAIGNVKVKNLKENYEIFSEKLTYFKNSQKIITYGKTKSLIKNQYTINSDDVTYLIDNNILSSKKKTDINDNKSNFYFLDQFSFDANKEQLKGKGVLIITNFGLPKSDKIYFSDGIFNLKKNVFVAGKTKIEADKKIFDNQNQDPRLIGVSSKGQDNKIIVNKGVFTSCDNNENCPPWAIYADKIIHDKDKKQLEYDNAVLKIYDFPVLYFPKFFHPDPSVKRQSGFLRPQLNESSILGSSLYLPYFKVLSESKDMTLRPRFYDKEIYMLQTEYRQENKNSSFIADFGYTYGYKSELENHDKNTQIHFFSDFSKNLNFDNFINSSFNAKFNKVNNDYYLKVFDSSLSQTKLNPLNKDVMSSSISINLDHEDYSFDTGMNLNEKLTVHENSDRFDYVLPYYNFSTSYVNEKIPGLISFKSKGNNTLKNTNNLQTKIINDLEFQTNNYITKNGIVNKFNAYYKNVNTYGKKDPLLKNSPSQSLENIYEFTSSWPLYKENQTYKNTILPRISYRINPNGMNDLSGNSTRILYNNVFNINRINDEDSFEEGQSITIGSNFIRQSLKNPSKKFEYGLATVLRPKKSNNIPSSSTINEKQSNYFGSLKNSFNENFSLNHNFSIDKNLNTFNYNEIIGSFSINNFVTKFTFLEENTSTSDINTISNSTTYALNEKNYFSFETRRNRKINLTEYYDLVYEYKNDCLTAGIKFRKTYYKDNVIKPKEDLLLTLTLIPLTTYEHKVDTDIRFD